MNPVLNQILTDIQNSKKVLGSDFFQSLLAHHRNLNEFELIKIEKAISKKNKEIEQSGASGAN